ncbi:MAG TPA: hypothetical protein VE175_08655 [Woeseiaceae bacterium]|nr:hypothetical protein [Woeseiaceae bacterium]
MKRPIAASILACLFVYASVAAHVSPMVQLVRKGEFVRTALPGASQYFERGLDRGAEALNRLAAAINWQPSAQEIKVYVGRNAESRLVGSVVFLRVPSEHGPVGVGVAFNADGRIAQAAVTEVGSEPLAWVRPLLDAGALAGVRGLAAASHVDATAMAPEVQGRMSRYYAEVIADGIERAGVVVEAEQLTSAAAGDESP